MTEEHRETGIGWPEVPGPSGVAGQVSSAGVAGQVSSAGVAGQVSSAGASEPVRDDTDEDTVPVSPPAAAPTPPADVRPVDVETAETQRVDVRPVDVEPREEPAGRVPAPEGSRTGGGETRGKVTSAGVMIAVLLAVLGFALVIQLKNVSDDPTLGAARQEDLVRILSDLQAREQRLRVDIGQLEASQRQLASGVEGGQAALEEATRRADELGILAGSLPATGPGLLVRFDGNTDQVKARAVLDAVQELRGAGAEAMQISGVDGGAVRIVASTYFLDGNDGINVDGRLLTAPYTIAVIGDPETMRTALNIPGGVVELVGQAGGTVNMEDVTGVAVTARHGGSTLQYARPVS